jgi:hypothetical protein
MLDEAFRVVCSFRFALSFVSVGSFILSEKMRTP